MTKKAGYKVVLQIDDKTIVGYRSHSMDIEADMVEITTGASTNQWKEHMPLFKGAEFSMEGLYDTTAGSNQTFDEVADILIAGNQVTVKYGGTEVGDKYYQASAYIRRVHHEGDYADLQNYSVDIIVTGEVTPGTVAA